MMRRLSFPLLACAVTVAITSGACRFETAPLEAFDVVITPSEDCTLTGATSRDCVAPEELAQQHTRGRWIVENGVDDAFTVTTHDGITIAGIVFDDDAFVLNEFPCDGPNSEDGGFLEGNSENGGGPGSLCYFGRRRFESTDANNNGCTTFGELVLVMLRQEQGFINGILADTSGTDQDCGTSTVVQRRDDITGTFVAEPSDPRASAAAADAQR